MKIASVLAFVEGLTNPSKIQRRITMWNDYLLHKVRNKDEGIIIMERKNGQAWGRYALDIQ